MKNIEIYTDRAHKKAIIVADERLLGDLRAACIAYSCVWNENRRKAEEAEDEREIDTCRRLSNKYSDYYLQLFDAEEQIREQE